ASILDVEELEEGMLAARVEEESVPALFERLAITYRVHAETRGLRIERDAPAKLKARFDRGLIGRVVENLLDNGVRYAPRGGRVVMRATRDARDLLLQI